MEATIGNEFAKAPRTVPTFFKGFIGKFLEGLFDLTALHAFIFVKGHTL
jgi:hypothetical protein